MPDLTGRTIRCLLFDLGETLWTRKDQDTWNQQGQASSQRALALLQQRISPELFPSADTVDMSVRLEKAISKQARQMIINDPDCEPDPAQAVMRALHQLELPEVEPAFAESIFEALRVRIPTSR